MNIRRAAQTLLVPVLLLAGSYSATAASAGDCCRQLGIGYGAGYHAPATMLAAPTYAKAPGYLHWKGACCHPGTAGLGGGCGCDGAPTCCPTCQSPCGLSLPCRPLLGGFGGKCPTRNAAVY